MGGCDTRQGKSEYPSKERFIEKTLSKAGLMTYICNSCTLEAEAEISQAQGQPSHHRSNWATEWRGEVEGGKERQREGGEGERKEKKGEGKEGERERKKGRKEKRKLLITTFFPRRNYM